MYHRISAVASAPLGVKGWIVTLECGHKRHLYDYPSDWAFREGCACDECNDAETWDFDRFTVSMPHEAAKDLSRPGQPADDAAAHWAPRIARPTRATRLALAAELREYGAWSAEELEDDAQNWQRILWIAAGNIRDNGGLS